jgi:release factor glutamine methyltransferase
MWETYSKWEPTRSAMPAVSLYAFTIRGLLADTERALAAGPHAERARRDAEALLLLALRRSLPEVNRAWLIAHEDDAAPPETANELRALVLRRATGEPMQYIAGEAEFRGLPFLVNRHVLIPRPETEHLVEKAVALAANFRRPRILDAGTGSGAIVISIRHECPDAIVTATEISESALALARQNAARLGFADRIRFLEGDLLQPVAVEPFDIIVSNPPYVPECDRSNLSVEIRDYEPAQALFAGEDGLAIYRRLIPAAFGALVSRGYLALEIGFGQELAIGAMLAASRFTQIEFAPDLQGIPRVASAQRP